jgi:DNA polymerase-3 subunit alpha
MNAVRTLGGFNLNEADDIRKAMGKKIKSKMDEYKDKFIRGAIVRGCEQNEAEKIWHKLQVFSGYGFNKSHATAYSMMGYISQYLKCYYPLEFWTVSLTYSRDYEIAGRLSEMNKINNNIEVKAPDINKSNKEFTLNYDDNSIYWGLSKISQLGDIVVDHILKEREKSDFYTFEEAYKRFNKKDVNKRVLYNMILAGCFDNIEKVDKKYKRYNILTQWSELTNTPIPTEINTTMVGKEFFWNKLQREMSDFGHFNYGELLKEYPKFSNFKYISDDDIYNKSSVDTKVVVCGILQRIIKRKSKRGRFAVLNLEGNFNVFSVMMWSETYEKFKTQINKAEGKIVAVYGIIKEDKYKGGNVLQTLQDSIVEIIDV